MFMKQSNISVNDCTNSCDIIHQNSSCIPCTRPVLIPPDQRPESITPVLTDNIVNCTSINSNQFMRSSPVQFMIDACCTNYFTNGRICIDSISYNYDCLGKSLPVSFYLCDRQQTFNVDGGGCTCFFNAIPDEQEELINAALTSANSTAGLAESALATSSPVTLKTSKAIAASQSLGTTLTDTASALSAVIGNAYSGATVGTIERAVLDLTSANNYIASAANTITELLTDTFPYPASTVQQIALDIYNPDATINSATEYITQAAQFILSSSTSSAYAQSQAQTALAAVQAINQLAQTAFSSPSTQTFTDLTNLVLSSAEAATDIYNALNDVSSGDSTLQSYLESLYDALYASTLSAFASQAIYSSTLSTNESSQVNNLNSAARAILDAVEYIKDVLDFPSTLIETSLYNNFKTLLCSSCCNSNCCHQNNNCNVPVLFFQEIPSYEICNLTIRICGTISGQNFTATADYPGITDLSSFGFNSMTLNTNLCVPRNCCLTLKEQLNPCFTILCIIPDGNYNSNNSTNAPYIQTSLYSYFSLNTNLIVTKKKPAALASGLVTCS